ncbi:hypothetical protein, partial [Lentzea sp.]|uniref:hypothetical protein n=1 Tax=Lentzea sp. TaxID=56099 RepID=UPI002ED39C5D
KPRAKAKSEKPRAKSQERKAKSEKPRAKSQERKAKTARLRLRVWLAFGFAVPWGSRTGCCAQELAQQRDRTGIR